LAHILLLLLLLFLSSFLVLRFALVLSSFSSLSFEVFRLVSTFNTFSGYQLRLQPYLLVAFLFFLFFLRLLRFCAFLLARARHLIFVSPCSAKVIAFIKITPSSLQNIPSPKETPITSFIL